MGKVDIWMPIYIGDYLRDTEELSATEHGAYLLLLMHYWQKNGEIGSDIERLSRVARTDSETARFILGSYFVLTDGNYKNKRADIEMFNANKRRLSATENGKRGGRPVKINPEITGGLTDGLPGGEPKPNPQKSSSSSPSSYKKELCAPLKSFNTELGQEPLSDEVHDPSGYSETIRKEWLSLGGKVYQPDIWRFSTTTWRNILPLIKEIHSDDIIQAIHNFGTILNAPSGTYYWDHRIGIEAFFQKHLEKFLPNNFKPEDFKVKSSFKSEDKPESTLPSVSSTALFIEQMQREKDEIEKESEAVDKNA